MKSGYQSIRVNGLKVIMGGVNKNSNIINGCSLNRKKFLMQSDTYWLIEALFSLFRDFTLEKFGKLFFEVLFLPYWQMYGELSIEDIEVIDSTGCYNETQKICYSSLNTTTNVSSEICVTNGAVSRKYFSKPSAFFDRSQQRPS